MHTSLLEWGRGSPPETVLGMAFVHDDDDEDDEDEEDGDDDDDVDDDKNGSGNLVTLRTRSMERFDWPTRTPWRRAIWKARFASSGV